MGIKNYKTNLINSFPDILVRKPRNVYYLCIDLNMILHQICHKCKSKSSFESFLINELNKTLRKIRPKFLAIFTDGQAILAKAHTQIKRRNKYLYHESSGISPLNLTPGTPFMDFVDKIILDYLSKLNIGTYYSGSRENNEGEVKLFYWLKSKPEKKTIIMGNDSDLVVLCLASIPLTDMYIYNYGECISIPILLKSLLNLVDRKFNIKYHPVRMDFVLLSLFQGNDYNSKIANFNKLLKSYKNLLLKKKGFLIRKNGTLNLKLVKIFLEDIKSISQFNSSKDDVNHFFKCINWNLNLYIGRSINNFIPKSISVNISSILKYFPNKIEIASNNLEWLHSDVYLLLLMPIVGKNLLPERLKKFMNDDSPIRDLFPDPCPECIIWKNKLKELNNLISISISEELKKEVSDVNINYSKHIKDYHSDENLYIERIQKALNLL